MSVLKYYVCYISLTNLQVPHLKMWIDGKGEGVGEREKEKLIGM